MPSRLDIEQERAKILTKQNVAAQSYRLTVEHILDITGSCAQGHLRRVSAEVTVLVYT